MGIGHSHNHAADLHVEAAQDPLSRDRARRALWTALIITAAFMIVEVIGGLVSGSLALIADAGHMLTDVSSLGLALLANWFSGRIASARQTYGWHRLEILAAFLNGLTLLLVAFFVAAEAIQRFEDPPEIQGGLMLVVALAGLGANIASGFILLRASAGNINVKGAFLHVVTDTLGSVGALLAALLINLRGWYLADPILSIIISVLVIFSAWSLIRECVTILLQSTPTGVSTEKLGADILATPGVDEFHDLHVWTMTSGYIVLTVHVVISNGASGDDVLHELNDMLEQRYGIHHTTIQIEQVSRAAREGRVHG